ncbi:MAG TPA: hypothetical protein VL860_11620 [Planctomycetota bacterium]|nr:hypothetical protein [Planctomycetota bacterium]
MSEPLPRPPATTAATAAPAVGPVPAVIPPGAHPAFAYRAGWRYWSAQIQWGLILSGLLAGVANLALDVAFRFFNQAANRAFAVFMPKGTQILTWSALGYVLSAVLLILGIVWGISWRVAFRHDFQRRFRL